ncbi:MAG: Inner membrane ABC transporter permease protein YcjP [Chloroflexi bacterium]|nr:Inner membrane ABC transporter permease protein YcjP [Chloroflexota bacterium]
MVKKKRLLNNAATYGMLLLWALIVLFPLYWVVTTSFKEIGDVFRGPRYIPWVDFIPTTEWWYNIWTVQRRMLLGPVFNSLVIATSSSLFAVIFGTMAAYGLERFRFKFGHMKNKDILLWIVSQRVMPPVITALALFIMFHFAGLLDTKLALIFVYIAAHTPIAVWMMTNFISQLPISIEEAALVDGASRVQVFFRIVLPMVAPSIAVTFLLCFIFAWNEFLLALMLTGGRTQTLPLLIAAQHFQRGPQWWDISVLVTISIIPAIILVVSLQRYLIKGLIPIGK